MDPYAAGSTGGGEPPKRYFDAAPSDPYRPSPATSGKPTGGLYALGIITIIVCSIFVLISCCGLGSPIITPALGKMSGAGANPSMDMMKKMNQDSAMMVYGLVSSAMRLFLFIAGLVGGVGIIKLRAWGRRLSLAFAGGAIFYWIVETIVNMAVIQPRVMEAMQGMPGAELAQNIFFRIGTVGVGFLCYNILPVVLLIVLLRGSVKEQFAASEAWRRQAPRQ